MMTLALVTMAVPAAAAVLMLLLDAKATAARARGAALTATLVTFLLSLALGAQFQGRYSSVEEHRGPVVPKVELRIPWLTLGGTTGSEAAATAWKAYSRRTAAEMPEADVPAAETTEAGADGGAVAATEPAAPAPRPLRLEFYFGMDGISVAMILLTTLLCVSSVLISWTAISERPVEFYVALLILEAALIGVFLAFDLVLFYVFFEFTLIPLFLMIGVWGGPQKRYAANKFFIYTLAGGMITLLGLVALVVQIRTSTTLETPFSIPDIARTLEATPFPVSTQVMIFLALSAGFMVKVPVFPFHTWLPLAHTEAPTAGSVLLAGVLLKLGSYGFLRLCLPILPDACVSVGQPLFATLSVIGILYGSLCSLAQNDIKKLVAYSSVAHLGFCMLGLFALNVEGITGGVMQMINHGLSTGALFLIIGMFYERYHTRLMSDLGGMATRLPLMATWMVFICLASIGLPGLNGFVGEMLSLIGMFKVSVLYAALGALGVILGAWYLLGMLQHAFFGPLKEPKDLHGPVPDMSVREFLALFPLAAMCLYLGVLPQSTLNLIEPDVQAIGRLYQSRLNNVISQTSDANPAVPVLAATEVSESR